MKAYRGMKLKLQSFLIWTLDGVKDQPLARVPAPWKESTRAHFSKNCNTFLDEILILRNNFGPYIEWH
jgi:hypothetical protein